MVRAHSSSGPRAQRSSARADSRVPKEMSWSAGRSTWSARSWLSRSSPEKPNTEVDAARDHRQQEGEPETEPQASAAAPEPAEQDQRNDDADRARYGVPPCPGSGGCTTPLAGEVGRPSGPGGG